VWVVLAASKGNPAFDHGTATQSYAKLPFVKRRWWIGFAAVYLPGVLFFLAGYPALLQLPPAEASDIRDVVLKASAGILALAAGVVSIETLALGRQQRAADAEKLWTDRFSDAIQLLGSGEVHVRLGALYALERLGGGADTRPADRAAVWEVISAYARHRSQLGAHGGAPPVGEDIQAALTILGRPSAPLAADLAGAWLPGARLTGDLTGARLGRADLRHADLHGVVLTGADLHGAELTGADLTGARLDGAANLSGARLGDARLAGADLAGADCTGANLTGARLASATLRGASFATAVLTSAVLTHADLRGADLTDAVLLDADLTGAWLCGADLSGARLTDARFDGTDLTATVGVRGLSRTQLRRAVGVDPVSSGDASPHDRV
jgi:uncharacterized protein YjbI with pentapeptide repeats